MRMSIDDNSMVKKAIKMVEAARSGGTIRMMDACMEAARDFAHLACRELEDVPEAAEMMKK